MQVLTKEEFRIRKNEIMSKIEAGAIFIHPTDTIYGIGCNALDNKTVKKIREIKERYTRPFSVIAPGKKWIYDNCITESEKIKDWIEKLPGPYTLILKLNNKNCIAPNVNTNLDTLGVRIPNHWFTGAVIELGLPIVTTSANITSGDFMTNIDNLSPKIKHKIDFIIYEGEKIGHPSEIIDLTRKKVEVLKR